MICCRIANKKRLWPMALTLFSYVFCELQWLEIILATATRKRSGDEKQLISSEFGLRNSPSLVYFALCTGAFSDPVVILAYSTAFCSFHIIL